MSMVAITLMRNFEPIREEWRDMLDERWLKLLTRCGIIPFFLPNDPEIAKDLLRKTNPSGLLLSGGGNCSAITGKQDCRDLTEEVALNWALIQGKPVFGVCRGMQMVMSYFGGSIRPVKDHTAVRHEILIGDKKREVNSFHDYGFYETPIGFSSVSISNNGVIESAINELKNIYLVMWHPEREKVPNEQDIKMIKKIYGVV